MFIATNRMYVVPELSEEFETYFRGNMRTHLPGVPGLLRSTLLKPTRDDQPYVSVNEFESEDAFHAWVASEAFRKAHKGHHTIARLVTGNEPERFTPAEDLVLPRQRTEQ